jgi:hypothetical protein
MRASAAGVARPDADDEAPDQGNEAIEGERLGQDVNTGLGLAVSEHPILRATRDEKHLHSRLQRPSGIGDMPAVIPRGNPSSVTQEIHPDPLWTPVPKLSGIFEGGMPRTWQQNRLSALPPALPR